MGWQIDDLSISLLRGSDFPVKMNGFLKKIYIYVYMSPGFTFSALGHVALWGVNHPMEDFTLCLSSLYLSFQ